MVHFPRLPSRVIRFVKVQMGSLSARSASRWALAVTVALLCALHEGSAQCVYAVRDTNPSVVNYTLLSLLYNGLFIAREQYFSVLLKCF